MANPDFNEFIGIDVISGNGVDNLIIATPQLPGDQTKILFEPRYFLKAFLEKIRVTSSTSQNVSSRARIARADTVAAGVLTSTYTVVFQSQLNSLTDLLNEP